MSPSTSTRIVVMPYPLLGRLLVGGDARRRVFQARFRPATASLRRHSIHEGVHQWRDGGQIQIAEGDHDVAKVREDPEVAVHAGRSAAVPVGRRRSPAGYEAEAVALALR